uniref:Mitochondrial acidic protein MAM33 n=1 Tax=Rhizophora mucronata TaxID=61149 RepID=A0A2P2P0T3_RHIMU
MPRITPILNQVGRRAIQDLDLLKVLQSEIKHELSSPPLQDNKSGSLGAFVVDSDSSQSEDVVLRRKFESGEEVAVSALLGPETFGNCCTFPRAVLMKVCLKKPGLSSILQFDCGVTEKGTTGSQFDIYNAYYFQSLTSPKPSVYRGPLFSTLDPSLQDALKDCLVEKGITESLTSFLLLHLHKKEQGQYINWLHKLESLVMKSN